MLNANHTALTGNAAANQSWGYDALGNWLTVSTDNTTQTRTANAQNEYGTVGNATLAYDANGDMITDEAGQALHIRRLEPAGGREDAGNATLETDAYDGAGPPDGDDGQRHDDGAVLLGGLAGAGGEVGRERTRSGTSGARCTWTRWCCGTRRRRTRR